MKAAELSVFFPAYNEEKNIANTVKKASAVLRKIAQRYEVIIVNDGSADKTGEIADSIACGDKNVRVIHHRQNKGYGEALKSGFYHARYRWIATTDADGQFNFSEITKFLKKSKRFPVVWSYRLDRKDPFYRRLFGWGWTMLANFLLGFRVRDVDCSFKLVKKDVIEKISHLESTRGGMISPELLAKAKKAGFAITEVGVHHYPRKFGRQTGGSLKVIVKSFIDLLKLWKKLR